MVTGMNLGTGAGPAAREDKLAFSLSLPAP
jgi:hypothetical protein